MKENQVRSCIDCGSKSCERMDGANPPFCLTTGLDQEVLEEAMLLYTEDDWNAQTADIESPDFVNDTIRLLDRFNVIHRPDFQEKLI